MINIFLSMAIAYPMQDIAPLDRPLIITQAASFYLPISTSQSPRPNCVTYTARNTSSRTFTTVYLNRRNDKGEPSQYSLNFLLPKGKLEPNDVIVFDLCDRSFVNVEAKEF
ncbi:MAG: hypothetical protein NW214_07405 [Pseudanabaenaceae cyanobacterium bins.39]|nr:hypothetical protein [Pseudanabaenaceae cyanobacterium bins.39]